MDKFDNPPPGKAAAYYVVMRPKNITPMQIDVMYQIALLMLEQNATYDANIQRAAMFPFHSSLCQNNLSPIRFKKRVPAVIRSLPGFVQKFVRTVCKLGVDPKKPYEVGNFGYDSGYDW
jgi:hypothetical protein